MRITTESTARTYAYACALALLLALTPTILIPPPAHALSGFTAGTVTSWDDLGRRFQDWNFNMKRGVRAHIEWKKKVPLWGAFAFCLTSDGKYRWAAIFDEQTKGSAIDLARTKLNAQPGTCSGSRQEITFDQWSLDRIAPPQLSQYARSPEAVKTHDRQTSEIDRLRNQMADHLATRNRVRTTRELALWELERDKIKIRYDDLKKRHGSGSV